MCRGAPPPRPVPRGLRPLGGACVARPLPRDVSLAARRPLGGACVARPLPRDVSLAARRPLGGAHVARPLPRDLSLAAPLATCDRSAATDLMAPSKCVRSLNRWRSGTVFTRAQGDGAAQTNGKRRTAGRSHELSLETLECMRFRGARQRGRMSDRVTALGMTTRVAGIMWRFR
jgi:hypothetical protein